MSRHERFFGVGQRSPSTLLMIDERDALLRDAAAHYPGLSDREVARRLRTALVTYQNGRWRRDRVENLCPPQHAGKLMALCWAMLKTRDHVPSERTIRAVLARAETFTTARGGQP
jgi:hypothetical protein